MWHPWSCADTSIFLPKIRNFSYIKKYKYRLHFNSEVIILVTFFESLNDVLMNMFAILMMPAKLATLCLLKGFLK